MSNTKPNFGAIAVIALISLSFSGFSQTQQTSSTKLMTAEWIRAKAYTKEYLDRATDDAISFKPTPEMRSFGEQMIHLAEANYGLAAAASGKTSPVNFGELEKNSDKYKTTETLSKAVLDSYDFVIEALSSTQDSTMQEQIKLFNFTITREAAFQKAFEHQTHHRGQTTVYLRLKGIKPPDEKLF